MITFEGKIELTSDAAHWYLDFAAADEINVFELFEYVLEEKALKEINKEE